MIQLNDETWKKSYFSIFFFTYLINTQIDNLPRLWPLLRGHRLTRDKYMGMSYTFVYYQLLYYILLLAYFSWDTCSYDFQVPYEGKLSQTFCKLKMLVPKLRDVLISRVELHR